MVAKWRRKKLQEGRCHRVQDFCEMRRWVKQRPGEIKSLRIPSNSNGRRVPSALLCRIKLNPLLLKSQKSASWMGWRAWGTPDQGSQSRTVGLTAKEGDKNKTVN